MKEWIKYLMKLSRKDKEKIKQAMILIEQNKLDWLDIAKLKWYKDYYRVRIWKFRIVYQKTDKNIDILNIDNRWEIYKKY